nr:ribonuclease III [Chloroflexota bacterium]
MEYAQGTPVEESPRELATRLGLGISDYRLISRALTHRSYLNENPDALEDNERLEFLGDAVLDFLVGAWLYNRFPEMSEGQLTRMRSALVRTEQLAEFASQLNLSSAMRLGRGEAESGGRERPALLCATFEALIGAIYLGADIPAVQQFVEPLLDGNAHQIYASGGMHDPKSKLQEWTQARGRGAPR